MLAPTASATPILSVTALDGNEGSILIAPGESTLALAAGFSLSSAFSGVTISSSLTCLQCQAQFFLMKDAIGPGSDFVSNVVGVTLVDTLGGGGFINQSTTLFSGISLDPATYYLVMALTSDTISGAIWSATQNPLVTTALDVFNDIDFMAPSAGYNFTTAPLSDFLPYVVDSISTSLLFSLDIEEKQFAVPEPASLLLLLAGLLGIRASRRRSA